MKPEIREVEITPVEAQPQNKPALPNDVGLIKDLEVKLKAQLGEAKLTVEQLYGLKVGEIIGLESELSSTIVLELNGNKVAEGILVAQDQQYAIQITKLVKLD